VLVVLVVLVALVVEVEMVGQGIRPVLMKSEKVAVVEMEVQVVQVVQEETDQLVSLSMYTFRVALVLLIRTLHLV
jgi:hypothetical protein